MPIKSIWAILEDGSVVLGNVESRTVEIRHLENGTTTILKGDEHITLTTEEWFNLSSYASSAQGQISCKPW